VTQKTRRVAHGVAVSTLFSAIALLYGTAAQAAFYPGHIDPGGTGIVPGFHGDFVVNIDSSCLSGFGWQATNQNPLAFSGCGNASLYSATIDLYSVDPGDPPSPGVILGHFVLGPGAFPIVGVVSTVPGQPDEIDTDPLGPAPGLPEGSHFDWVGDDFWLQFVSGSCQFGCTPLPGGGGGSGYIFRESLTFQNLSNAGIVTFGPACATDAQGLPINCVVPQVPEPGTLGLILGALGGGWLARRRKKKAATA
jgi:PEP-CTERM motif